MDEFTQSYLTYIVNRYLYLDYKGIGFLDRVPRRLKMMDVFVPLKTRPYLPKSDTWSRFPEEQESAHAPVPILPLLAQEDGLVLLGDPGSGKTTFLKYVALSLATGQIEHKDLNGRLPLVMPISAYADQLQEGKMSLQTFFEQYFVTAGIQLPLGPLFQEVLQRGNALLLLDGLDEVRDIRLRHEVVEQIANFFAFHKQVGNKMIVTSRLVGYREARLIVNGVVECTLTDLDEESIHQFIDHWTRHNFENEPEADVYQKAKEEKGKLIQTIQQNPALRILATNPLLLTIMILMYQQGVVLPQRRVTLYDRFVRTLIQDWNLTRSDNPDITYTVAEIMRILAPLALWMEETSPGTGLVQQQDLRRQLEAICRFWGIPNPDTAADQFLHHVRASIGILTDRGGGQIGFLHHSFQEYLAGWAVAQRGQSDLKPVESFIRQHLDDVSWWELLRLTIGIIGVVQQREEAAGIILRNLMEIDSEYDGAAIAFVGKVVNDIGPSSLIPDSYISILKKLEAAAKSESMVPARWRISIGRSLGRLEENLTTVDQLTLCFVPPGPFIFGQPPYEETIDFVDYGFWISQSTITNAQYAEFVADHGYSQPQFWQKAAAVNRWQSGTTMDWESLGWRQKPFDYGDPFNLKNHPVVGISWYEADAFSNWLQHGWQKSGFLKPNAKIRLPSEIEWEKSARGGLKIPDSPFIIDASSLSQVSKMDFKMIQNQAAKRIYSWGNESPVGKANYNEEAANQFEQAPNFAGCFQNGASPYGCLDMCGNVWEWTCSLHQHFPYHPMDGRETEEIKLYQTVALRGGAFWNEADKMRVVSRVGRSPNSRSDSYGFRICIKQSTPPS